MATFEILDGYASVRANQRIQRSGRQLTLGLLGAAAALVVSSILARSWSSLAAGLLLAAILAAYSALLAHQRTRHTHPIDDIVLEPGQLVVEPEELTVVHPMLRGPLVVPLADLRSFAVETSAAPDAFTAEVVERFPVGRKPGVGYRQWEPHFLLSTEALEQGRRNVVLLHLSLDDPVRPTYPDVALLFREPVSLIAAIGLHDREAPAAFLGLPRHRRTERALAEDRNREWTAVEAPGLYLRVADPHRLRRALLDRGVREGVEADDVPGAPPHLPLPPPGTT